MKTETKAKWVPSIGKLQIRVGEKETKEIPIFQWKYTDGQFIGFDLMAWPQLGEFTLVERRDPESGIRENYQNMATVIKTVHNLEEPPYMPEIWEDIRKARELAKAGKLGEFLGYCTEAEKRWKSYIA